MTALQMISLPVDLRELRRIGALHGLGADEGRALHHFLGETFGRGAIQPFRLMPGRNGARFASLYGYTRRIEADLRQEARDTGLPETAGVFDLPHLAVKAMPEAWQEGRRLAFDIRIRPVKRLLRPLEGVTRETRRDTLRGRAVKPMGKGAELDAYLVARVRAQPQGQQAGGDAFSREDVYRAWLAERLHGAILDPAATRMVSCERMNVLRGGEQIEAPDVIFHGELTISDPGAFLNTLAGGVGRHKAYGYGMLLLRPARK